MFPSDGGKTSGELAILFRSGWALRAGMILWQRNWRSRWLLSWQLGEEQEEDEEKDEKEEREVDLESRDLVWQMGNKH